MEELKARRFLEILNNSNAVHYNSTSEYKTWVEKVKSILSGREDLNLRAFSSLKDFKDDDALKHFFRDASEQARIRCLYCLYTDIDTYVGQEEHSSEKRQNKLTKENGRMKKSLRMNPLFWIALCIFAAMVVFGIVSACNPEWEWLETLPPYAKGIILFGLSPTGALGCLIQLALSLREWWSDKRSQEAQDGGSVHYHGDYTVTDNRTYINKGTTILGIVAIVIFAAIVILFLIIFFVHPYNSDGSVTKEATCTAPGEMEYTCSICGRIRIKKIEQLAHDLNEVSAVAPTCTEDGNVHYFHCKNCERNFSDRDCETRLEDVTDHATGHVSDGGKITREPTCIQEGEMTFRCTVCGIILGEPQSIDKTEHTFSDERVVIKESTCTTMGKTSKFCTVCGAECETEEIPEKPHTYQISETYWTESGYSAPTESRNALIPCTCSECHQKFILEWNEETFSFADSGAVRIEDKYHARTAVMFDNSIGYLIINLSGSNWSNTLKSLQDEGYYNPTTRVLTISSARGMFTVKSVKIIGRTASDAVIAIVFGTFNALPITLQNLSYVAPNGYVGLNLENVQTATLEIVGSVSITGGKGANGLVANDLNIVGHDNPGFSVKGGDGSGGVRAKEGDPQGNGSNGSIGLSATNLTIDLEGWLSVSGGNGGNAYDYTNQKVETGNTKYYDGNNGDGSDGWRGHTGGAGGCAINVTKIVLKSGTVTAQGGRGGDGGDAGECNLRMSDVKGGQGGQGGQGGEGITAKNIEISTGGSINANGGRGGDSGKRGGAHKNNHHGENWFDEWNATDGDPGTPGIGGKGISDGCSIEGDRSLLSQEKGQDGTQTQGLNQDD